MKSACKDGPFRIAKYPINAYGQKKEIESRTLKIEIFFLDGLK